MAKDFQSEEVVAGYDTHIRKLIPGYELVHQQIDAILMTHLPETAHILIVGCGTGYELSYLLQRHPQWYFTAIDPSHTMLEQVQKNIESCNGKERVQFIQADTQNLNQDHQFDAALAILVAHFIPQAHKTDFFQDICQSLKPKGFLLTYDLMQHEDATELKVMQQLAQHTGLNAKQSERMIEQLEQDFHLISGQDLTALLTKVGFKRSIIYCQIMNYYGFLIHK
ncbi:class I SAM-dependent methyltransferase [Acinetobacter sp. BY484]|uniref:class I SAM-dependent methyltransferase n=1 Tax=Acinetobacter sp. BY484 TaxID=2820674 RepID=UPI001C210637|nr:class I SAM-dependent methyltransferase [Acinetobacter sp. BY484]